MSKPTKKPTRTELVAEYDSYPKYPGRFDKKSAKDYDDEGFDTRPVSSSRSWTRSSGGLKERNECVKGLTRSILPRCSTSRLQTSGTG